MHGCEARRCIQGTAGIQLVANGVVGDIVGKGEDTDQGQDSFQEVYTGIMQLFIKRLLGFV